MCLLSERGDSQVDPLPHLIARLFLGVLLLRQGQPLLGKHLGLRLLLAHLEALHLPLHRFSRLQERRLVFYFRPTQPA